LGDSRLGKTSVTSYFYINSKEGIYHEKNLHCCCPFLHPKIDNDLPDKSSFQWIGWEFLEKMNSRALVSRLYKLFDDERIRTG